MHICRLLATEVLLLSTEYWSNLPVKVLQYQIQQAVREAATICLAPCKLTFDLLTLKVVSESLVT